MPLVALLIIENGIVNSDAQIPEAEKIVETLSMNVSANPDIVSVGDNTKLLMIVTNNGNSNATITSIELSHPWSLTDLTNMEEIIIEPKRTALKSIELKIPGNASSGDYNIAIKLSTSLRDYDVQTVISVNRIESLPLSDNIPLSILVLIFSGVITYSIGTYLISQKFERSYVELGLWSGGLGFLNWGILFLLAPALNMQVTLELIQYDFYSVALIIGIGAFVGTVAGLFYRIVIKSITGKLKDFYKEKASIEEQKISMRKGFWRSTDRELVWPEFAMEQLELIKDKLGKNYSITLKIYLKSPVNGVSVLTGILKTYEDMGTPYDMVIFPKYKTRTRANSIIDVLNKEFNDGNNIISGTFNADKQYMHNVKKHLKLPGLTEKDLSIEIIGRLRGCISINRYDLFEKILEAIDFSLYANYVMKRLNSAVRTEYDGPIFVQGDNIMNVEVIKYETIYALTIDELNKTLPKVYRKTQFPLVKDVTADTIE